MTEATGLPLLVSPSSERVIAVEGSDRLSFLDDTTSQALRDVAPGLATAALVLDANGLPLLHLEILVREDDVLLVVPDGASVETVMAVLAGRTFLADARFVPLEDAVVVVHGPDAADAVAAAGRAVADGRVATHGAVVVADARHGGRRLVGPRDAVTAAADDVRANGAGQGEAEDLDAWRIAAGIPAWGREITAPHLPEELGLLPTHVHLAKGCYPGQEAVARMWMLGRPRRRLGRVRVSGDLAPGWTTGSGRDEVRLTSVAVAHGIGLALVPGETTPGSRFSAHDGAVEVLDLPGDDPVPPGHDPRMRRRREQRHGDAAGVESGGDAVV